ncbi:MAG: tetratricopeptide repeat protein, partial [Burkholderiales bacterium]|nr:tetratricopeptide repeat protein [Phycisphaerae bacterium]
MQMNRLLLTISLLLLWTFAAFGQTPVAPLSPAQQKIKLAQAAVERNSEHVQHHNDLAAALVQRAHEAVDPFYYEQANVALQRSFRLAPDNFDAEKISARILLGQHEFTRSLKLAKELNHRSADDIQVYALIADAAIELGDYREAEEAVQWMLNLRYAGASGLARVARLRQLFGDLDGAFEMINAAYEAISPSEAEERAWNRTQAARLALTTGNVRYAEKVLQQALKLFPEYHHALRELAGVR